MRGVSIEAILQHVEIERAQLHNAEIIYAMVDLVKCKLVVPADDVRRHGDRLAQHILIEDVHLVEWDCVVPRIKIVQVAQNVAKQAVANLAIALSHPLHQLFGTNHVFTKID